MTAKAELLKLVGALDDTEAASVLDTLQAARFRAVLAAAKEVEPDALDRELLASVTGEDRHTAISMDADFKQHFGIVVP